MRMVAGVAGGQFGLWRCGRPGLRGLIAVRFRPPMDGAALRGHWNRWMATLTRRFMHRLPGGPATPTGMLFDTRLSRPFPRPCEGPGKTGEDHTRVGCHRTSSKVSRRSHLLALPPAGRRIEQPVTWRVSCERTRPQLQPISHWCGCPSISMVPGRRLDIGEALGALP